MKQGKGRDDIHEDEDESPPGYLTNQTAKKTKVVLRMLINMAKAPRNNGQRTRRGEAAKASSTTDTPTDITTPSRTNIHPRSRRSTARLFGRSG